MPNTFGALTRTRGPPGITHIHLGDDVFRTLSERQAFAFAPMIFSPSEFPGVIIKNRNDFVRVVLEISEVIVCHVPRGYSCRIQLILENFCEGKFFSISPP